MSGIAGLLAGLTVTIAELKQTPEIGVDPTEAKDFAKAAQDVLRHYNVEATQKAADWITLIGVTGNMVGFRIAAYAMRRKMEREQPSRPAFRPTVVPMPQAAPAQPAPATATAQVYQGPSVPQPDYIPGQDES